ncbi:MAG TPA: TRAP transporter TatT component family protein [Polyangiales bacterium]|nr:TRAP transporter TatT component family protein [Polyangiales bacterium]
MLLLALALLLAPALAACASDQSAQKPAENPSGTAPAADTTAGGATDAQAPAAKPTLCDVGNTESEVSEEVLARSGRGLLWLVVPDRSDPNVKAELKRGADEVRSARTLAECMLRHWDPGFDATQSKGHDALVTWVDAHVGPEHAETLLAAGAAYFASLLVAESWIDAALDVPAAKLFLERATAAAPQLADGLGPLILGAYQCFVPKAVGGQPTVGLKSLQDAASRGGSLSLAMKVAAAELCAFSLQDRPLFDRLLTEVEQAKASNGTFDLLAKERAKTLRTEVDDLFPEM